MVHSILKNSKQLNIKDNGTTKLIIELLKGHTVTDSKEILKEVRLEVWRFCKKNNDNLVFKK